MATITYDIPFKRVLTVDTSSGFHSGFKKADKVCPIVNISDVMIDKCKRWTPFVYIYLDFVESWTIECLSCGSNRKLTKWEVENEKKKKEVQYYQDCCSECSTMSYVWPLSTCPSRQPLRGYYVVTKITDNTDKHTLWKI